MEFIKKYWKILVFALLLGVGAWISFGLCLHGGLVQLLEGATMGSTELVAAGATKMALFWVPELIIIVVATCAFMILEDWGD